MRNLIPWFLAGSLLANAGCASDEPPTLAAARTAQAPASPRSQAPPARPGESQAPAVAARKIIYSAEIGLVVEDFNPIPARIAALIREHGGYIAELDLNGSAGSQRRGLWKLRVPIDRFEAFLGAVASLGVPEKNKRTSEDVTDRYYDTESRIKNKKVEEARLIKLLEDRTGKLDEILLVEHELSRVRGEVEQLQGALQLLANLTGLTTVAIAVEERKDYVPPTAPTFAATAARTLRDSTEALVGFLKSIALVALAFLPWLPIVALVGLISWLLARRVIAVRATPIPIDPRTPR